MGEACPLEGLPELFEKGELRDLLLITLFKGYNALFQDGYDIPFHGYISRRAFTLNSISSYRLATTSSLSSASLSGVRNRAAAVLTSSSAIVLLCAMISARWAVTARQISFALPGRWWFNRPSTMSSGRFHLSATYAPISAWERPVSISSFARSSRLDKTDRSPRQYPRWRKMILPKSWRSPSVYKALPALQPNRMPSQWARWATMRECSQRSLAFFGAIRSMTWCMAMENARLTTSSLPRITTAFSTDTICRR